MDSSKELAITVEYKYKVYKFKECQDGLYYHDTAAENHISDATDKSNFSITTYLFLSTVDDNTSYFSSNETEGANIARKSQQIIGWPSIAKFKSIIKNNLLKIAT